MLYEEPDFYYCQTVVGLLIFLIAAGPRQGSHFGAKSRRTRDHILLSQIQYFLFHRLLRLAGLRWKYSTPHPHGIVNSALNVWVWVWVLCYDRRSVGQFVLDVLE
jgi:hypothetical protein